MSPPSSFVRSTAWVAAVLLASCASDPGEDPDPAGELGDAGLTDAGPGDDGRGPDGSVPPAPPPEVVDGVPRFQLPFPCGQVWAGQTRVDHSPPPSVDFNRADDLGDPVVAAASGTVARVENLGSTSYGRWIEIAHVNGYRTRYAHLASQAVTVGQAVVRGQRIGTLGSTGGSTGPHLHYEQRHDGVIERAVFNGVPALYYGTKNYTSQNCEGAGGVVGRVNTGGPALTIRATASPGAAAVGTVADGAQVTITCQSTGASVTGTYGASTLWDRIGVGFVPDAFVSTGSDGQVAPTCP